MKKTLLILSLALSFTHAASADISCQSSQGRVVRLDRSAPLDSANFNVVGNDVRVEYSSSTYSSTFGNRMKSINNSSFYRVERGFCGPVGCLSQRTIAGYTVYIFDVDKGNNSVELTEAYIESPGKRLSARKLKEKIANDDYEINGVITAQNCK